MSAATNPPTDTGLRLWPTWKGNLAIFGILVLLVIGYYFHQIRQTQTIFFDHAHYQARTVAGVIQRNAQNALLTRQAVEEILGTFLGNTAKFVDYLNTVAPFNESELTAFSLEAGLAGISIVMPGGHRVQGPVDWLPVPATCGEKGLSVSPSPPLYTLSRPMGSGDGCVIVGIHGEQADTLLEQVSLPKLLDTLSGLAPIQYIRIEKTHFPGNAKPKIHIKSSNGRATAEARLGIGTDSLLVGLDAGAYTRKTRALWREFMVFSTLLAGLGAFFSWLLHRYQQAYVNRVRELDRELARQRKDAALGSATAAIAHEIRNPLNAISMGLQRLQLEAPGLAPDHISLLDALRQAVGRTNEIVTNLKRYTTPLSVTKTGVDMNRLVQRLLALYRDTCHARQITVRFNSDTARAVRGDTDLLAQAVENLLKNAIEAQPRGGFLTIGYSRQEDTSCLTLQNGGFHLPGDKLDEIFEPYMTTKARGTGLGLAMVKRIIHAHQGTISAKTGPPDTITLTIRLPLSPEGATEGSTP